MGAPTGPPVSPSPLDLTDLDTVKGWLKNNKNPAGDADDYSIQLCITACSMWWLRQTGLGNESGINAASPLNSQVTYTETYDGNGSNTLYLRNRPIVSVTSLTICGVTIQQSTAWGVPGWVVDQSGKCIKLRGAGGGNTMSFTTIGYPGLVLGQWFIEDVQNVTVTYVAGFSVTPLDVQLAVTQQVGQNVKRKEWIDVASRSMGSGAGSITFRKWTLAPEVQQVLTDYTRTAM
jgi:hypothetical protein